MAQRAIRRRSVLESNMARWGGWDTGGPGAELEVQGNDFLGVVARSKGTVLGPLELDVLSWLTARWYEQQRDADGLVRCTLYELGVDLYGRKPSGKEVRLLRGAIENLAGALISLGGFDAHTNKRKAKFQSLVHLVESAVWAGDLDVAIPTRAEGAATGALRGNSYEIKLASWLVRQLEQKYVTYLDWRKQRRLDGLAKRLWVYLEAEQYKATGGGRKSAYIILGEKAYTALGVHHARDRDRRAALKKAAARIVEVDENYEDIAVEPNPVNRSTWRILATRFADAETRDVRALIRGSIEQSAPAA